MDGKFNPMNLNEATTNNLMLRVLLIITLLYTL